MSKRKAFSVEEKAHIIWRLENGESNNDIAKELNVSMYVILIGFLSQIFCP